MGGEGTSGFTSFAVDGDMQDFALAQITFLVVSALGHLIAMERSGVVEHFVCEANRISVGAKYLIRHGEVISLVDCRMPKQEFLESQLDIVLLRVNQTKVALVVDELVGSINARFNEIIEPALEIVEQFDFLEGGLRRGDSLYHIINMGKLLGSALQPK